MSQRTGAAGVRGEGVVADFIDRAECCVSQRAGAAEVHGEGVDADGIHRAECRLRD